MRTNRNENPTQSPKQNQGVTQKSSQKRPGSTRRLTALALACGLAVVALTIALPARRALAAVINVATFPELGAAVNMAGPGDIINVTASFDNWYAVVVVSGKAVTIQSGPGGPFTLKRAAGFHEYMLKSTQGSSVTLNNLILDGDSGNGNNGGGVWCDGGGLILESGAVIQNNANINAGGGGVLLDGDANSSLTINGGAIIGNSAYSGGGVYAIGGTLTMISGTISGNHAREWGGGLYIGGITQTMSGGVITGNTATLGGSGVYTTINFSVEGTAKIGTSDGDNSLERWDGGPSVISVTDTGLLPGARVNVAPVATDVPGTLIAQKATNPLTAAEAGYFHYMGTLLSEINPVDNKQLQLADPLLTVSVGNQTVPEGAVATFTAVASGGIRAYHYAWREYPNQAAANADVLGTGGTLLTNGGAYSGTATASLSVTASAALNGRYYKAFVTDSHPVNRQTVGAAGMLALRPRGSVLPRTGDGFGGWLPWAVLLLAALGCGAGLMGRELWPRGKAPR